MTNMIRNFGFLSLVLLVLAGCSEKQTPPPTVLNYLSTPTVDLDVARIEIYNGTVKESSPDVPLLLPASIYKELEEWIKVRFRAVGSKGVAKFTIRQASVIQKKLMTEEEIKYFMSVGGYPQFGVYATVLLKVEDSGKGWSGYTQTVMDRTITLQNPINVAFHTKEWTNFLTQFLNDLNATFENGVRKDLSNVLA